jgi:hypothetical protein
MLAAMRPAGYRSLRAESGKRNAERERAGDQILSDILHSVSLHLEDRPGKDQRSEREGYSRIPYLTIVESKAR